MTDSENMEFAAGSVEVRFRLFIEVDKPAFYYSPAAQCSIYHLHNDVCRFFDLGKRSIFYGYDMGLLEDDGFHRGVFGHWLFRFLFTVSLSSRGFIQGRYRKMKIGQVKFVIMHELFKVPYYL